MKHYTFLIITSLGFVFSQGYELDNIRPVGHIPFDYCSDVWGYTSPDGHEFALVGRYDGTSIVDISTDPHEPVEVGFIPGALSGWRDLKVHEHYCYVTNESNGGVDIIDLSDPFNPVKVNAYTGILTAHNIFIADGYAYIFGHGSGFRILDLADPENPVEVGSWETAYFHDGYVKNDTLYGCALYGGSLFIVDVSEKTNPVTMVEYNYSTYGAHAVWVSGNSKYAIMADEIVGGYINIVDIQDFNNINHLATWYPDEPQAESKSVHNVFWKDDLLYISYYVYGTRVVDMSDPANPQEVGYYDFYPGQEGLFRGNWGTYPYTANGLIYSTDFSGNGFFVMSFPFYGEIHFTLLGDTEDIQSDIPLSLTVEESDHYDIDYSTIMIYWGLDNTITDSAAAVATNDSTSYIGNIAPAGNVGVLHYYVSMETTDGQRVTKPYGAPYSTYSFNLGPDQVVPIVNSISELDDQFYPNGELDVYVEATDNFGIDSVELRWDLGDGQIYTQQCIEIDGPSSGIFFGTLIYSDLELGTEINYWALVTDASSMGNQIESEMNSFFVTDDYVLGDFEDTLKLDRWNLGTWGRQYINSDLGYGLTNAPFAVYEPNSNDSCDLIEPLDLIHFDHAYLTFMSWEIIAAGDFGFVQIKQGESGNWQTMLIVNGLGIIEQRYVDLNNFLNEDELYIRLLFTSDNSEEYIGWFVDDIHLILNQELSISENVNDDNWPHAIELHAAYPNPFNPTTTFRFSLPQTASIKFSIYNLQGRLVRSLFDGIHEAGEQSIVWDATDDTGQKLSSGVYIYSLEMADQFQSGKVVLLK